MSQDGVYLMSTFLSELPFPFRISWSTAIEILWVRCKYLIVGFLPVFMTRIIALLSSWNSA
eukprot:9403462-Lingulodinium_polyedra.AAC.1